MMIELESSSMSNHQLFEWLTVSSVVNVSIVYSSQCSTFSFCVSVFDRWRSKRLERNGGDKWSLCVFFQAIQFMCPIEMMAILDWWWWWWFLTDVGKGPKVPCHQIRCQMNAGMDCGSEMSRFWGMKNLPITLAPTLGITIKRT